MDRYFAPLKCRREPAEYHRQSNPSDLAGHTGFTGSAGSTSEADVCGDFVDADAELLDASERRNSPLREPASPPLPMPNLGKREGQSINSLSTHPKTPKHNSDLKPLSTSTCGSASKQNAKYTLIRQPTPIHLNTPSTGPDDSASSQSRPEVDGYCG